MKKIVIVLFAVFSILIISTSSCDAQCYGIRNKNSGKVWYKGTKSECDAKWASECKKAPFHRQGAPFGVPEEEERKLHDELENKRIQEFKSNNVIIKISDEQCAYPSFSAIKNEFTDIALL